MTVMSKTSLPAALALALLAGQAADAAAGQTPTMRGTMQPPGDPERAVRSEFDTFAARGTVEAYELFIARHPDHPLAREARRRIDALRGSGDGGGSMSTASGSGRPGTGGPMPLPPSSGRPGTGGIMPPPPDHEKAVRSEFDTFAARGTVEAYELFIARHPDHPLAREARRRIAAMRKRERNAD